jgi:hypothetical protein
VHLGVFTSLLKAVSRKPTAASRLSFIVPDSDSACRFHSSHFTIHYSLFTILYSPFTIRNSLHVRSTGPTPENHLLCPRDSPYCRGIQITKVAKKTIWAAHPQKKDSHA